MTGWRFTCPNGHTSYRYTQSENNIHCWPCQTKFSNILDKKTGQLVPAGERQ